MPMLNDAEIEALRQKLKRDGIYYDTDIVDCDFPDLIRSLQAFLRCPHPDCLDCEFEANEVPCPFCNRCGTHCGCPPDVNWINE